MILTKKIFPIFVGALLLPACDDDSVEVVEVEKQVVVENTVTVVETVEVPVIVQVPAGQAANLQIGARPSFLAEDIDDGELKSALQQCSEGPFYRTDFSIGHRGASLQFPEHTKEAYESAAKLGAGIATLSARHSRIT
ncbi:hypothetical protein [Alteromonas sp. S015]|uniref:hypothetical protein n=1 Tax=Alteromonas sp. S015 TaxID=3117401 RepID=UPI003F68B925